MPKKDSLPAYLAHALRVIEPWVAFQRFIKEQPGIAVGIVEHGKVRYMKGFGLADVQKKMKVTPDTAFRIASISKTFTAIGIMQLWEQGKLNLDDPIHKHLPWEPRKQTEPQTIRHVLMHAAGINRDGNTGHWSDDEFPRREKLAAHFAEGIETYSPVSKFKYSNFAYGLLGEVIKTVSGMPYEEYMTKNIVKPLGMTHTYPDLPKKKLAALATGYGRKLPGKAREIFPHSQTKALAPATGFISTVRDLSLYVAAQAIGSGKLLKDQTKREMQRVQWMRDGQNVHYGLGYEIWYAGGLQMVGHSGGFAGFITRMSMDLEHGIGIIVLTNAIDGPGVSIADGIVQILNHFRSNQQKYKATKEAKAFDKYNTLFVDRWGDLQTVNIDGHLIGFDPSEEWTPLRNMISFVPKDTHRFVMTEGNEFSSQGELFTFQFNAKRKLTRGLLSAQPLKPFELPTT